ncbi:2'-5' RNA ligase family protein [Sphingomonas sp. ABOLD]|uniref:2'-5' RNA ligase n=1 Tax=Sphingomonas trueperi TaxID=53317 RepID=A0A7X5Y2J9_9SPHN|nr:MULTISPECIES: 2'-5' RNA ligase family protein [Sphingomonas]NJB98585.1 2'-5' RNA ligase [Sphingomonas trueperi]RSV40880.1 2'-5' RNA ligase family protein [Sphingomonas sp. ABOLE]RSV44534.1 2'-5' RNA ligase family protein [Sphingomonas sp. ABOLD]
MSGAPAPLIVTALFGRQDQAWFDSLRRAHFPPERNQLDAHLTLFHHLPPSVAEELKHRLARETRGVRAPRARVSGLMSLGQGVAYRIEAPELEAIRAGLLEAFAGLLTPQDAGRWRPHVTVQNKVRPVLAKALLRALAADFAPKVVEISGLASWWYRGGPWELHSRHMFA